jgi:tetratricopeptide (TPR) repeat protein
VVVAAWTSSRADALRSALRMSNETFAQHLGVAVRTVAYWRKRPDIIPQPVIQEALDVALERAPIRVQVQFQLLMSHETTEGIPLQANCSSQLDPDAQARVRGVVDAPSRLDRATVAHLTQALYGQRHAEDSLGPSVMIDPMSAQLSTLATLLRGASGPHQPALMHLVANWTTFIGWLHTALCEYPAADATFARAEELSDELGDGVLASTATSYRGYLALLQGRHRAAIRATAAALGILGAHPTQLAYDTLQSAQAYAGLGDFGESKNLLHRASDLVTGAGDPPESLYWYTEPFLRMNIGLTQHAIGQYSDAADSISSGMDALPADQQNAEWLDEYRHALDCATERTDAPKSEDPPG